MCSMVNRRREVELLLFAKVMARPEKSDHIESRVRARIPTFRYYFSVRAQGRRKIQTAGQHECVWWIKMQLQGH